MTREEMNEAAIELIRECSSRYDKKPVDEYDIRCQLLEELDGICEFNTDEETKIAVIALYKFEIEGFRV